MKKVLIIAGTGVMGRAIIPLLLEKSYEVDAVSLEYVQSNHKGNKKPTADFRSRFFFATRFIF